MALEIRKVEAAPVGIIADRRLYLSADKARVVEDGDPAAAFLLATPGTVIPAADVAALGIEVIDGCVRLRDMAAEAKASARAAAEAKAKADSEAAAEAEAKAKAVSTAAKAAADTKGKK